MVRDSSIRRHAIQRACRLAVAFVVALLAKRALAPERFVDAVDGSDATGDESATSPWRTITHSLLPSVTMLRSGGRLPSPAAA
jgi:hypothetical protein